MKNDLKNIRLFLSYRNNEKSKQPIKITRKFSDACKQNKFIFVANSKNHLANCCKFNAEIL